VRTLISYAARVLLAGLVGPWRLVSPLGPAGQHFGGTDYGPAIRFQRILPPNPTARKSFSPLLVEGNPFPALDRLGRRRTKAPAALRLMTGEPRAGGRGSPCTYDVPAEAGRGRFPDYRLVLVFDAART